MCNARGSKWDDGVKAIFETEFQVVQLYQANKHLCLLDALYMQIIFLIVVVIVFVLSRILLSVV